MMPCSHQRTPDPLSDTVQRFLYGGLLRIDGILRQTNMSKISHWYCITPIEVVPFSATNLPTIEHEEDKNGRMIRFGIGADGDLSPFHLSGVHDLDCAHPKLILRARSKCDVHASGEEEIASSSIIS